VTTPIAAEFLAWRSGKSWSRWHISCEDVPWQPLCGAVIPKEATTTTARQMLRPGMRNDEMCATCLQKLSEKGT